MPYGISVSIGVEDSAQVGVVWKIRWIVRIQRFRQRRIAGTAKPSEEPNWPGPSTIHPNERIEPKLLSVVSSILTGSAERFSLKVSGKECDLAAPVSAAMGTRIRILARMPGTIPDSSSISLMAFAGTAVTSMELPFSDLDFFGAASGALAALWAQARISHRSDEMKKLQQGTSWQKR